MLAENSPAFLSVKQVSLLDPLGSNYLLKDISFSLARGDRLCTIGSSGAGKTTLLRLLNRLIEPSSGSIALDNRLYDRIPTIQLRQQVVLVPQEPKLLGMSVREALAYPLVLQQLPKAEIQQRLETWRSQLHIPEIWLDRNELQLSLGQRQLVAIARGLVMHPKVLLLDEPTSALDTGAAHHLLNVLANLSNTTQTAIVMVNHQLGLVRQFARRVLYLRRGELWQDTTSDRMDWEQLQEELVRAEARKMDDDEFFDF